MLVEKHPTTSDGQAGTNVDIGEPVHGLRAHPQSDNSLHRGARERMDWCRQRHALNASAARSIAQSVSAASAGDAFLAGLIQDVGIRVRALANPCQYHRWIDICRWQGEPIADLELMWFGTDHGHESAQLIERFDYPNHIVDAVRQHHADPSRSALATILAAAEALTNFIQFNSPLNLTRFRRLVDSLGIAEKQHRAMIQNIENLVLSTASILDVSLVIDRSINTMIDDAHSQLISPSDSESEDVMHACREMERLTLENESLARVAHLDPLTGLANRRSFDQLLADAVRHNERQRGPLTLILCDIDRFKDVNDSFGHSVGDQLLKRIADVFQSSVRKGDCVCRFGGEEIAVVAGDLDFEAGQRLAERLRTEISAIRLHEHEREVRVTASFGLATAGPETAVSTDALFRAADQSLYRAKHEGRDCVRWTQL